MILPKIGSKWDGGGKEFVVLAVVEQDKHMWVHYRDNNSKEYSCYLESFLRRFRGLPE
jgi:hypothetical protein